MKEPKRYKLNNENTSKKEPTKLPLRPIFTEDFDEILEKRYDYYNLNSDSTFHNKDLEELKIKNKA